jgi:hemerythrin-like domain-containing protein
MEEHRAIKLMLAVLDNIADRLDAGESIEPAQLEDMVEFIRVFADSCHHAKEEGLLFKEMEAAGVPAEGGPITVMLQEHEMGRTFVAQLSSAVERYKNGDNAAAEDIADNARHYAGLLSLHIEKEDNILYPLADERLSGEAQRRLEEGFERVEREIIGPGRHEQFHNLLRDLEDKYLTGA